MAGFRFAQQDGAPVPIYRDLPISPFPQKYLKELAVRKNLVISPFPQYFSNKFNQSNYYKKVTNTGY